MTGIINLKFEKEIISDHLLVYNAFFYYYDF